MGVGVTLVLALRILWFARRAHRVDAAHRFAREVDLALPPAVEPSVARLLGVRRQTGAVAGIVTSWLALLSWAGVAARWDLADEPGASGILVALVGVFVGEAIGHGLAAWRESVRPAPAGPRVARASSPGLADYVADREIWLARGAASIAALITAAVAVLDRMVWTAPPGLPPAFLVTCGCVPALLVVVSELAGARLAAKRQVAATTLELAWDDARRSRTLRDMVGVPMMAAVWVAFVLGAAAGNQVAATSPEAGSRLTNVTHTVLILVLVAYGTIDMTRGSPHRHFRRRLWSTPVPGDTAIPAEVIP